MIVRLRHHDGTTQEWEWSGAPTLGEARTIKERCKLTIAQFLEGFEQLDPDCITAMLYLLYRREGTPVAWDSIDCSLMGGEPAPGVPVLEFEVDEDEAGETAGDVKSQAQRKLAEGKDAEETKTSSGGRGQKQKAD